MIPFVAGLASSLATTAFNTMVPKFAHGGIVPGHFFSGDKVPVLANSGEMFLNQMQQANLFRFINGLGGGGMFGGDEITFRLRGEDIVGSIKNFDKRRRRNG